MHNDREAGGSSWNPTIAVQHNTGMKNHENVAEICLFVQ